MKRHDYYLGENYLKTKKNLYCIKTYNMIFGGKQEISIYQVNKENRFTRKSMASNNFKTTHIQCLSDNVWMYQVNNRLHDAILKRINGIK